MVVPVSSSYISNFLAKKVGLCPLGLGLAIICIQHWILSFWLQSASLDKIKIISSFSQLASDPPMFWHASTSGWWSMFLLRFHLTPTRFILYPCDCVRVAKVIKICEQWKNPHTLCCCCTLKATNGGDLCCGACTRLESSNQLWLNLVQDHCSPRHISFILPFVVARSYLARHSVQLLSCMERILAHICRMEVTKGEGSTEFDSRIGAPLERVQKDSPLW